MAEQTIILRPTSSGAVSSAVTLYPSDTVNENVHLLVNEVEADDDATYAEVYSIISTFEVLFNKPQIKTITSAKLHCRCDASQGVNFALSARVTAVPGEGSSLDEVQSAALNSDPGVTGWADYVIDFSNEALLMEALNNIEYTQIGVTCYSGNGKASGSKAGNTPVSTKYTQIYLELIYEGGETVTIPLYLRENGAWVAVDGTVYQKVNGAWVESSTDVFQEGDSYKLVTL